MYLRTDKDNSGVETLNLSWREGHQRAKRHGDRAGFGFKDCPNRGKCVTLQISDRTLTARVSEQFSSG
jgi:hypothetical protein